ncbi:MAG: alpha-1,2-fucosyltransferase [Colwellia sp.]
MKVIRVCGGLGNQLFQYAFYLRIKHLFNEEVKLDVHDMDSYTLHNGYELERIFNLNGSYCSKVEKISVLSRKNLFTKLIKEIKKYTPFIQRSYIKEKKHLHFSYQENDLGSENTTIYYRGSWQNPQYFNPVAHELRAALKFPPLLEPKSLALCQEVAEHETVAVHIRRGDYLKHKALGGICDLPYYQNAMKEIKSLVVNPVFVIFSDDIPWCRENIKADNIHFVDWNSAEQSFQDMHLMSLCKHNIIANSSFSWWGAWLNSNPNKIVISPDKWIHYTGTMDIVPDEWLKVSTI